MIPFIVNAVCFWFFIAVSLFKKEYRIHFLEKPVGECVLDCSGMIFRGAILPVFHFSIVHFTLAKYLPDFQGMFDPHPLVLVVVSFLAFDYISYWQHRLLHSTSLWSFHATHHMNNKLDVVVNSRISFLGHISNVFLFLAPLVFFVLKDPTWFVIPQVITSCLEIWRHAGVFMPRSSLSAQIFRLFIITPLDHHWHHGMHTDGTNFGLNFPFWDKIHGTYHFAEKQPDAYGVDYGLSPAGQFFYPLFALKFKKETRYV